MWDDILEIAVDVLDIIVNLFDEICTSKRKRRKNANDDSQGDREENSRRDS